MNNPNLAILELVAKALGPVCDDVVFVGGCATGLLLTLARPERIRVTEDVDIIAQALTVRDYHAIEAKVRALRCWPSALIRRQSFVPMWRTHSADCGPMPTSTPPWLAICQATHPAKAVYKNCVMQYANLQI